MLIKITVIFAREDGYFYSYFLLLLTKAIIARVREITLVIIVTNIKSSLYVTIVISPPFLYFAKGIKGVTVIVG